MTGHFQSFFFFFFFSEFFFLFFFQYVQKNSKTSKVIFKYFIIFLKIWTGQSLLTVSLSKMHRQYLKKKYFFFSTKQLILRVGGQNKIFFLEIKFYFFPTFRKITVGGFVNQLIKKFWPYRLNLTTGIPHSIIGCD